MMIVLGLILVMVVGSTILASTTITHQQIDESSLLNHYAYRALQTGIADYDYNINSNFDYLSCNSTNTPGSTLPYPASPAHPTAAQILPTCSNVPPFQTWQWVEGTWSAGQTPEYYMVGNPTYSVPTQAQIAAGQVGGNVTVQFYGAAGYAGNVRYQYTTVTFKATNQFELNLYWSQLSQVDDGIGYGNNGGCSHFNWSWASAAGQAPTPFSQNDEELGTNHPGLCQGSANYYTTGNVTNGPVFTDDSIFVSGTAQFNGPVVTADPWCIFTNPGDTSAQATWSKAGCAKNTGANAGFTPAVPNGSQYGAKYEPLPVTNQQLLSVAQQDGCVYAGPTYITLSAAHPGYMTVYNGRMQASRPPTAVTNSQTGINDPLISPANPNQCMPYMANTLIPIPANGVIFVSDDTSGNNCPTARVVANEYETTSDAQVNYGCRGDAIVQGSLYGHLTIAAYNNVIVDGDLTKCLDPAGANPATCPAPSYPLGTAGESTAMHDTWTPPTSSSRGSSSVIGLIANQFLELNNPGGQVCANPPSATTALDPNGVYNPAYANLGCHPGNVDIEAAVLALNHSFMVNNFANSAGTTNYTVYQVGAVAERFFETFGTFQFLGNGGAQLTSGYNAVSTWDPSLAFIGAPSYLKTGTNGDPAYWDIVSSAVGTGQPCTATTPPPLVAALTDVATDVMACNNQSLSFPSPPPSIPNVAGDISYAAAQSTLQGSPYGYVTVQKAQSSTTVPAGNVIGTYPAFGTQAAQGSVINVFISTGP